jgi:hypothetical protein
MADFATSDPSAPRQFAGRCLRYLERVVGAIDSIELIHAVNYAGGAPVATRVGRYAAVRAEA